MLPILNWRAVSNWRAVLRHAWSLKLNILLSLASAAEAAITYVVDGRLSAGLVVALVSLIAGGARLVKQETVSGTAP